MLISSTTELNINLFGTTVIRKARSSLALFTIFLELASLVFTMRYFDVAHAVNGSDSEYYFEFLTKLLNPLITN